MGVIADKRLNLIKGLIRTLPQTQLRSLEIALGMTREPGLAEVGQLVSAEMEFRHVKDAVFSPFLMLFQPREDGLAGVQFPRAILDRLWGLLEQREPELYQQSRFATRGLRAEDPTPVVFFRLVTASAAICHEEPEAVLPPEASAQDREEVAEFANYLDLHRILRTALGKLHEFMGRIDAEKAAALRLMFRDSCAIDPESGYRFLECLFANLDDGAQIIKFVATVSDRPNDRFLASSELAHFGERILDRIDECMVEVRTLLGRRGTMCENLGAVGDRLTRLLAKLQSFETYIELSRDGPWGKRVAEAHKMIAEVVETQLKGMEKLLGEALPLRSERVYGKVKRDVPRFDKPPRPETLKQAVDTLIFIRVMRNAAQAGGFASLHAKVTQACEQEMDSYFETLLGIANGQDPFEPEVVMTFFEMVTDLMEALCGEDKAQTARRRVASSDLYKPQTSTAGSAA